VQQSSSVAAIESLVEPLVNCICYEVGDDDFKPHEWKKLSSKELGIRTSKITKPTRLVLNVLKKKGYEVYLVGGCVRDLLLKRTPKDFDIITSAELKEVLRTFPRCEVVGKRFPICHVHVDDTIVEVSSFSTCGRTFGRKSSFGVRKPRGCDESDFRRWRNCLRRDFTINGLMFDPYAKIVYDYVGGMEDIRKAKVRCVITASTSFTEDCARILRGVRIAARLGFRFAKETAHSVKELSYLLSRLDRGRFLMEMNYMLAYGSAEASLRLLWKFGLLEILLPIQAAYFVSRGFRRRDERSNMLLSLFSSLDKYLAPDRPCHCCLWVCVLAFHKALVDQPRDPLVVAAFSLAVHSGGSLSEAVKVAWRISQPHNTSFLELSEPGALDSDAVLMDEVIDLAASVKDALQKLADERYVSRALIKYPQAPHSDLGKWDGARELHRITLDNKQIGSSHASNGPIQVFISLALTLKVSTIFDCVRRGKEKGFVTKPRNKIDYESLALGQLQEVRRMFARIVFDTVYPPELKRGNYALNGNSST
ncbi:hypothetical protein RJ639_003828, partial [Escallonia herrerae]